MEPLQQLNDKEDELFKKTVQDFLKSSQEKFRDYQEFVLKAFFEIIESPAYSSMIPTKKGTTLHQLFPGLLQGCLEVIPGELHNGFDAAINFWNPYETLQRGGGGGTQNQNQREAYADIKLELKSTEDIGNSSQIRILASKWRKQLFGYLKHYGSTTGYVLGFSPLPEVILKKDQVYLEKVTNNNNNANNGGHNNFVSSSQPVSEVILGGGGEYYHSTLKRNNNTSAAPVVGPLDDLATSVHIISEADYGTAPTKALNDRRRIPLGITRGYIQNHFRCCLSKWFSQNHETLIRVQSSSSPLYQKSFCLACNEIPVSHSKYWNNSVLGWFRKGEHSTWTHELFLYYEIYKYVKFAQAQAQNGSSTLSTSQQSGSRGRILSQSQERSGGEGSRTPSNEYKMKKTVSFTTAAADSKILSLNSSSSSNNNSNSNRSRSPYKSLYSTMNSGGRFGGVDSDPTRGLDSSRTTSAKDILISFMETACQQHGTKIFSSNTQRGLDLNFSGYLLRQNPCCSSINHECLLKSIFLMCQKIGAQLFQDLGTDMLISSDEVDVTKIKDESNEIKILRDNLSSTTTLEKVFQDINNKVVDPKFMAMAPSSSYSSQGGIKVFEIYYLLKLFYTMMAGPNLQLQNKLTLLSVEQQLLTQETNWSILTSTKKFYCHVNKKFMSMSSFFELEDSSSSSCRIKKYQIPDNLFQHSECCCLNLRKNLAMIQIPSDVNLTFRLNTGDQNYNSNNKFHHVNADGELILLENSAPATLTIKSQALFWQLYRVFGRALQEGKLAYSFENEIKGLVADKNQVRGVGFPYSTLFSIFIGCSNSSSPFPW